MLMAAMTLLFASCCCCNFLAMDAVFKAVEARVQESGEKREEKAADDQRHGDARERLRTSENAATTKHDRHENWAKEWKLHSIHVP